MNSEEIENLKKAGHIAKQCVEYAKTIIKKDTPLLEIAEKIESHIAKLGGKPAFPVNLSINEIAAHYTPSWDDKTLASGLLKIDIGVQIEGFVADTAFSLDLENNEENKNLIKAAESGLHAALKAIKHEATLSEIGKAIEHAIAEHKVTPIHNLSGHAISQYDLHAGLTIPNYDTKQNIEIPEGIYAIEPFATSGLGMVRDGKPSGIYHKIKEGNVRDSFSREVLQFIEEEYETLPFCARWIVKKFGTRGLLALKRIEDSSILHHYPQLIEKGNGKVAQAEHTVILTGKEIIITTN